VKGRTANGKMAFAICDCTCHVGMVAL